MELSCKPGVELAGGVVSSQAASFVSEGEGRE